MRRIFFAIVAIAIALPLSTQAQETPAEQEAWDALLKCTETLVDNDLEASQACTHEDFVGWRLGEPVPRTKESDEPFNRYYFDKIEVKAYTLRPLSVKVYGNIAIIHYYAMAVQSVNGGEDENVTARWTDIMIKEDGKWMWIADHGGSVPGN